MAGWKEHFHAKFHRLVRFPRELAYLKCLPSCFCLERKHKAVKKFAQATCNTVQYERGVLMDVLAQELFDLKTSTNFCKIFALQTKGRMSAKLKALASKAVPFSEGFASAGLHLNPGHCRKDDFVCIWDGHSHSWIRLHPHPHDVILRRASFSTRHRFKGQSSTWRTPVGSKACRISPTLLLSPGFPWACQQAQCLKVA